MVLRVIPNAEAVIGMLRSGDINLLSEYGGDPDVLEKLSKDNPAIKLTTETDVGMEFLAFNHEAALQRRGFRNALSAAIDRNVLVQAAWNGYAVRSVSHISPAIGFWHSPDVKPGPTGIAVAREMLQKAGYRVEGGRLRYPGRRQGESAAAGLRRLRRRALRYLVERLIHSLVLLWAVCTILFLLFRLMPGNPMAAYINEQLSEEDQKLIMAQFGLDRPLFEQYLIYLANLAQGNLGVSFFRREPSGTSSSRRSPTR